LVKVTAIVAGLAAALSAAAAPARTQETHATWSSPTVLVGYTSDAALQRVLRKAPGRIVRHLPQLRAVEIDPQGDTARFAAVVSASKGIDYAAPPAIRRPLAEPALAPAQVPGGAYQWQYAATGLDRVPESVARSALALAIAVIDSGADLTAPDLAAKRPSTYSAIDRSTDVRDTVGHGTFVASLAAGSSTNGEGVAGVAGHSRLIVVKASSAGLFTDFELAAAITESVDRGARVINLSLGGTSYSATEQRAIQYAAAKDVFLVAAAGNEFLKGNPVEYPAALLQPVGSNGQGGIGLSVGASTIDGVRAPFSNTGSYISLAAPGHNVFGALSTQAPARRWPRIALPGSAAGLYGYSSGTSFAAPQVAGAAALVWGANSLLTARQVADVLKETASGHGTWNPELGYGVIDVAAAVARAKTLNGVTLRAAKTGTRVSLAWAGTAAKTYRLLVRAGNGPEQVVLDRTPTTTHTFEGKVGVTHVFVVESLDAAGNVLARSATAIATLGQARSSLLLRPFRFRERGKRYVVALALLEPKAIDTKAGSRLVVLEQDVGPIWRTVAFQFTDGGGRVAWLIPPGTHRLRARFAGAGDLAAATSRAITLRGA
jgi:subtilisin family serine protease